MAYLSMKYLAVLGLLHEYLQACDVIGRKSVDGKL